MDQRPCEPQSARCHRLRTRKGPSPDAEVAGASVCDIQVPRSQMSSLLGLGRPASSVSDVRPPGLCRESSCSLVTGLGVLWQPRGLNLLSNPERQAEQSLRTTDGPLCLAQVIVPHFLPSFPCLAVG